MKRYLSEWIRKISADYLLGTRETLPCGEFWTVVDHVDPETQQST
jgi:hypothetical protein